jgi:YggT family protein
MSAIYFLAETLLSLVFVVFLLRLLLQLARANFRNPVAQAIVKLTNPLVLPLRKVFPPLGKVDTASVIAVAIVLLAEVGLLSLLRGGGWPGALEWLRLALAEGARATLWVYFYAIFLYALITLVGGDRGSPFLDVLGDLCEPVLAPIRRLIPGIAGLDLSPLWAGIGIQALLILLR